MLTISFSQTLPQLTTTKIMTLTEGAKSLPASLSKDEQTHVKTAMTQAAFTAKAGTFLPILGGKTKIILAGISKQPTALEWQKLGGGLLPYLTKDVAAAFVSRMGDDMPHIAYGMQLGSYRFDKYVTKKDADKQSKLKKITFVTHAPDAATHLYKDLAALAESVCHARDLCNEPGNKLYPETFAKDIQKLTKYGVEVEILDAKQLREKGFNLLLAVAQGSSKEPYVAVLKWMGKKTKTFDMGLVGKGVTFDAGGINLKPFAGLFSMHHDMTGAAAVVTTIEALAKQKAKKNVIGIMGLVENMPSGTAIRPQDIVTSMSGQTVEILNTDAEGRLVLADCMWYLQDHYGVTKMIDIATLTAAMMMVLGAEYAGLFSNDDTLANALVDAGQNSGEKLWRFPMGDTYNKMLDSTVADMKNIGGPKAGSTTAACFLGRFVKHGTVWAHLDIAGVDNEEKGTPTCPKGATGFGPTLLTTLLKK